MTGRSADADDGGHSAPEHVRTERKVERVRDVVVQRDAVVEKIVERVITVAHVVERLLNIELDPWGPEGIRYACFLIWDSAGFRHLANAFGADDWERWDASSGEFWDLYLAGCSGDPHRDGDTAKPPNDWRPLSAGEARSFFWSGHAARSLAEEIATKHAIACRHSDDNSMPWTFTGPIELVAVLSRRFAPPVLNNTEGEPMLLCDATLRVTDPEALAAELDETYERAEDDDVARVWLEHVVTDGIQRIRAQLDLRGDQLHIHANSENRFERVLTVIRALDPSAAVLSETRQTIDEIADLETLSGSPPPGVLDPGDSPELAAALQEMVRNFEESWLDEEIPALSGHTPRECAADPTRRPDLIRLLDSFPDTGAPGTMSPARIRQALGLN